MGSSPPAGLGVIIVAERPLSDLLSTHDVGWTIQERQPSIAAMWDALSGGAPGSVSYTHLTLPTSDLV